MKSSLSVGFLPAGFQAAGISAKIKKSGKKDLALFYSCVPCVAAGMFTSSKVKAAPLLMSEGHLKKGRIRALIVNSGNANCMTGRQGLEDARMTARLLAKELSLKEEEVLVASTGIIGRPLPMAKMRRAIPAAARNLSRKGLSDAALAILTTDAFAKVVCKKFKLAGKPVTISGVAKGAGMIAPNMKTATMLAYCLTDAAIAKPVLGGMLKEAVEESFNAITIDGCMSTNDMVVVLANGRAENRTIKGPSGDLKIFAAALKEVCVLLAKMIVRDGEGATKFIEIRLKGAASPEEAKDLAFAVANSNLFKCAMFGGDANWGRIAAALGSVRAHLKGERLDISLNHVPVLKQGRPLVLKIRKFLKKAKDIVVDIDCHAGSFQKTVYTTDLSYGYVRINAAYS